MSCLSGSANLLKAIILQNILPELEKSKSREVSLVFLCKTIAKGSAPIAVILLLRKLREISELLYGIALAMVSAPELLIKLPDKSIDKFHRRICN